MIMMKQKGNIMENLRTLSLTVQQIELIRAALGMVTPKALQKTGGSLADCLEIVMINEMLEEVVDMGPSDEVHALWA